MDQKTVRFLALGDSYTIGEAVLPKESWPFQLVALLNENGVLVEPTIIAKTGWTTDELLEGIELSKPNGTYDLVSLLIGVNNQYRGSDISEYREQFDKLLRTSIAFADGDVKRVIVISIPDWGVTPFAEGRDRNKISNEIDIFNDINKNETEQVGAYWINITPGSRFAAEDTLLIAGDGLHPSGKMYALWVEQILIQVLTILGKK